jgi:hypothetical protein
MLSSFVEIYTFYKEINVGAAVAVPYHAQILRLLEVKIF